MSASAAPQDLAPPSATPARAPAAAPRDALVSLSLANLLGLRLWAGVLDPATSYFLEEARPWTAYAATLLLVAVLGAGGLGVATAARRTRGAARRALELLFGLSVGLAIWGARAQVSDLLGRRSDAGVDVLFAALSALPAAALLLPDAPRARARRALVTALLVLSPFVIVTASQAVTAARRASDPVALAPRPSAARVPRPKDARRVVIAVFDELDQFLAFDDRPAGIELPAFDGLASRSYHLTRARFPANKTEMAIPSILTGARVRSISDAGASDRRLYFEDGRSELFSEAATLLSDARAAGRNAALAGWYHPYCRVLGDDLVLCSSRANRQEMQGMSLGRAFVRQLGAFLDGLPHGKKVVRLAGLGEGRAVGITREWHEESWRRLRADARRLIADPELDLVFLHLCLPHVPGIRDRAGGPAAGRGAYEENLVLADRFLGDLVGDLRDAGLSDRTSLVVLADHPKRTRDYRPAPSPRLGPGEVRPIPILVHPAGAASGVADAEHRVSSLALRELVAGLLDGRFATVEDVAAFAGSATTAPSPGEE